ncbi:MAG: hypothetical protein LBK91_03345 [Synergistaceae bacterium]|jgi:hypothetical protein|nr:hypothetical protein [Synergistaceae bacterium]
MFIRENGFARFVALLVLSLFVSEISFPVVGASLAEAAWKDLNGAAPLKEIDVALDDEQLLDGNKETMRMANVLVMVEATAGMQFSPATAMPTVVLDGGSGAGRLWTESGNDGADWAATKNVYNRKPDDIINMMAGATFGIGAMPVAWSGANLEPGRNLYGRDLDVSNNYPNRGKAANLEEFMKRYKGDYYFPFKDTAGGIPTGYGSQTNGLEIGYIDYSYGIKPSAGSHYNLEKYEVGTRILAAYKYKGLSATKFPYALVFKDPQYWVNGWTKSDPPKQSDLVPNDSRLYQAKLVLWNLMENRDMWNNIRFGLASTFLPHTNDTGAVSKNAASPYGHEGITNRYDFSGLYKVSPFGANAWTFSTFNADGTVKKQNQAPKNKTDITGRKNFKNGVLIQAISGNVRGHNALHAQMYPMSQHMTNEIVYSRINTSVYSSATANRMKAMYKASHRASLLVPIRGYDETWTMSGKPTMTQAARFRLWIDGFADLYNNRGSQWHYYKNPEIGVAGVFVLPHAIYPDPRTTHGMSRANYRNSVYTTSHSARSEGDATAVWYSNKSANTDYKYEVFPSSTELEDPEAGARVHFNAGSGEAVGSVLDFFSPPVTRYSNLIPQQYPIRSACENNWIILITTGQEVRPVDSASYRYTAAQAIKNLYDATNKATKDASRSITTGHLDGSKIYAPYEKVSMLVRDSKGNAKGGPAAIDLDNPIRTLVIGMIPDPSSVTDPTVKAEVEDMKLNLTRMSVAGQGGNPDFVTKENMNDADYRPYLAYDTDTLMETVTAAIATINDGSVLQPAKGVVAQSRAISGLGDSSELFTYKYRILRSNQWEAELKRYVAKTDDKGNIALNYEWEMGKRVKSADRKVAYWKNGSWDLNLLTQGDSEFKTLTGLNENNIAPPPGSSFDKLPPSDALVKWFKGSDVSYKNRNSAGAPSMYDRSHLLTDFGQGGIVSVQDPVKSADFLPGYKQWADAAPRQGSVLYGQTNDGILHVVNQENGNEKLAILPPPSLVPGRLSVLTTRASGWGEKRPWITIFGPESMGGYRSFPAYILDGAVQKRDFDLEQRGDATGWGSYLLAALGRGGSGLYMLDVTDHDTPKLMWYKEKIGNQLVKSDAVSKTIDAAVPSGVGPDGVFMKLGFNSPKPIMGVAVTEKSTGRGPAKFQNFIVMAGGTQRDVDLVNNGKEGAVFLMLDPKDGGVLASFDSVSVGELGGAWKNGSGKVSGRPYMGMMVSEPTLLRSGSGVVGSQFLAGRVLAADNRGNIFSVDMEDDDGNPLVPSQWNIRTIASLAVQGGGVTDSRSIPHGLAVGGSRGYNWAAGGTADVQIPIQVPKKDDNSGDAGFLRNAEQLIFSFKLLKEKDQKSFFSRDKNDFKRLDSEDPGSVYNPSDPNLSGDGAHSGWYIPLRKSHGSFDEYVSTKPIIVNGTLYVATFTRKNKILIDDDSSKLCAATSRLIDGTSRLFAVDVATGAGNTWDPVNGKTPKYIEFKGVKIVGLTHMRGGGTIVMVDKFHKNNNFRDVVNSQSKFKSMTMTNGGDADDPSDDDSSDFAPIPDPPDGGGKKLEPNMNVIQYWITS